MSQKFQLDGIEHDVSSLSEKGKSTLLSLQFTVQKMKELDNMHALLQRAKNSYIDGLKKEMLAKKAGFILDE
jgi:hypothetical protein